VTEVASEPVVPARRLHAWWLPRLLWATLLSGSFAAVIFCTLTSRVPNILDTPMAPDGAGAPRAVPLIETGGPAPPVYITWLHASDPLAVVTHPELRILFATYGASVHLRSARLEVVGTPCAYEPPPGSVLSDNSTLAFVRNASCTALHGTPSGDLKLVVSLERRARVAVWTYQPNGVSPPQGASAIEIVGLAGSGTSETPALLRGQFVDYNAGPPGFKRIDLLNYTWQIAPTPRWLYAVLGGAALMMLLGFLLVPAGPVTEARSRWVFAMRSAAGTGLLAGALGIGYAVMIPPFQAPDESFHFLGYTEITHREDLASGAARWSSLIQFDRIRYHSSERFRPHDVEHPSARWMEATASDISSRSSGTRVWMLFSRALKGLQTAQTLLGLRALNVCVWALAVAGVACLAPFLTDVAYPQLLVFVYLFIPTLPFFGMFVSNYALLTSTYVLLAFAFTVLVLQGKLSDCAGLLLGGSFGFALTLSRSAVPMAVFCCFVPLLRFVGSSGTTVTKSSAVRRASVFWGGLGIAALTAVWLVGPSYVVGTTPGLPLPPRVAQFIRALFGWHDGTNAALDSSLVLAAALIAIAGLEIGIRGAMSRVISRLEPAIHLVCVALAALVAGMMILSLWIEFPRLTFVDYLNPPSRSDYVAQALSSGLAFFRLRYSDALLSTSFWAGFGWLDTIPPDWFIGLLSGVSGCALIALLLSPRSQRLQPALLLVCSGFLTTLAAYAVITLRVSPDLHGRYLMGLYLAVLSICWIRPAAIPTSSSTVSRGRGLALAAMVLFSHGYSLSFILRRYF
jgi:hypothetical protein